MRGGSASPESWAPRHSHHLPIGCWVPGSPGSQRAPGEKRPERCQQRPFPALVPGLLGLRQAPEEKGAFTAPVMQRAASSERGRAWRSGPWGWGGTRGVEECGHGWPPGVEGKQGPAGSCPAPQSPAVRVSDPGCWFSSRATKTIKTRILFPSDLLTDSIRPSSVLAWFTCSLLLQSIHFFVHSFKKYIRALDEYSVFCWALRSKKRP